MTINLHSANISKVSSTSVTSCVNIPDKCSFRFNKEIFTRGVASSSSHNRTFREDTDSDGGEGCVAYNGFIVMPYNLDRKCAIFKCCFAVARGSKINFV